MGVLGFSVQVGESATCDGRKNVSYEQMQGHKDFREVWAIRA
jgi:hypothetical protein